LTFRDRIEGLTLINRVAKRSDTPTSKSVVISTTPGTDAADAEQELRSTARGSLGKIDPLDV
jgi:hypothetical protein